MNSLMLDSRTKSVNLLLDSLDENFEYDASKKLRRASSPQSAPHAPTRALQLLRLLYKCKSENDSSTPPSSSKDASRPTLSAR